MQQVKFPGHGRFIVSGIEQFYRKSFVCCYKEAIFSLRFKGKLQGRRRLAHRRDSIDIAERALIY